MRRFTQPLCITRSVSFSPDGKTLATGNDAGEMKLWSGTGKHLATLTDFEGCVALAFSADGKTLVAGARTGTLKIWNVAKRNEQALLRSHEECLRVAFSPDTKTLASTTKDHSIKLWAYQEPFSPAQQTDRQKTQKTD